MSKLDGNGRWGTKMLLTEHQEQYQNRDNKISKGVTTDEIKLIREYVLLPHTLTMLQKSLDDLKRSRIMLHQIMEQFIIKVMDEVSGELYRVRRELKQHDIKVLSDESHDDIVYTRYICRGYENRFGMTREIMRSEIGVHLSQAYKAIITPLHNKNVSSPE